MSHSLRTKLSGLRYKGILEDKDYKRLCHALDLEKAEQESKTGHWKIANSFCTCDQCGYKTRPWNNTPFCPNCGAKMVELQERSEE